MSSTPQDVLGLTGKLKEYFSELTGEAKQAGQWIMRRPEAVQQNLQTLTSPPAIKQALESVPAYLRSEGLPKSFAAGATQTLANPDAQAALNFSNPMTLAGIVKPSLAKTLTTEVQMPEHPEFTAAIANTPGASVGPEGLTLKVVRRQLPEMDDATSVRTGVFYLPSGDKRLSNYTGKSGYGGSVKHEGDTVVHRPLFVKGATGGKAPQNAYDMLKGKGAYEAMRDDVLRGAGIFSFGTTMAQKIDGVRKVLEKYGADPSLASEIVRNSPKGNTLPYAVQENIVAHEVRNAGYDSVLGYTKSRAGQPVLSELFDTRELTYPSQFGDPTIHPKYTEAK